MEVSARGPSSTENVSVCVTGCGADFGLDDAPLPLGREVIFTSTGKVSSLKLPAAMAASQDDWRGPASNALRGKRNRLQTGRAEAVDGHRRSVDRQTGAKRGDARHVHALLAFGHGAAENHVVDFFRLKPGHARKRFLDGQRGKVVGTRGSQRAFVGAAYGSADGRNNYGFRHGNL